MPFDFPSSPTNGQQVTAPNGAIYVWDGTKWVPQGLVTAFAPLNSPIFTGDPQAPTPSAGDADTSIATTSFVASAVNTASAAAQHNVGRNLLHNPLFNVAQRGAGPWTTGGYTADRWWVHGGTDTWSIARGSFADGGRAAIGDEAASYYLGNIFTGNAAAGAFHVITQPIEDVRRLANKTVTVSFWAACATGTPKLGVSIDQVFGTGGSPSAAVSGAGTAVTINTNWTRYSITLTLASVIGKTLGTNGDHASYLNIWYSSGSTNATNSGNVGVQSGTVSIWGVQLEIGTQATPLEKPDPRYDLANCQRFYEVCNLQWMGDTTSGGYYISSVPFAVEKRAAPTLTSISQANASNGGFNARTGSGSTTRSAQWGGNTSAATGPSRGFNDVFSASADL